MKLFSVRVRIGALMCVALVLGSIASAAPAAINDRYAPGQLMVKLTPACRDVVPPHANGLVGSFRIPELDRLNAQFGVTNIWKLVRAPRPNAAFVKRGLDQLYLLVADSSADVPAMMAAYEKSPDVVYTCPNIMRPVDEVPNDPRYSAQWHLTKIQGPGAWDFSHGDTTVKIGVVDDGADFTHPDIARNVWINAAEDLNGNGVFDTLWYPDGDLDGIDDDGNGYVDDVVGFDFVDHDPIPMPMGTDAHGTHCWGVTNAVTDNDTGIASVGWGCRGMVLRAGGGGFVYMAAACEAIAYSINMGCWVTSHSYGSASPYQPEQDLMNAAWDAGAIVCAAAGNSGIQTPHYPGAYEVCVGVAATEQADRRTSWSNYGDWVELGAPGAGILSTVPGGAYASMDGTSMATPLVAGLCALIKAGDLGIDNQTCLDRLYNSCDTMPDPDYRNGLMGRGRINAMKALAINRRSYLLLTGTHLNDPNQNGIAEPGEVCGISATLDNLPNWQNAASVTATLSISDPDISISKSTATFPNIPAGGSGSCAADSFVFTVNPAAVPHMARFAISKTATPADIGPSGYATVQIGRPRILLVNDFATDTVMKWYRWACDSLLALYDQYSTAALGAPSSDTLRHYPVVIWATGRDSTNALSGACQTAIAAYLDNGGRFFISGQNIGQQIGGTSFYANYLRAQFDTFSTGKIFNLGVPGNPICEDDTIVTGGAGGAGNAVSVDGIKPINGALGSSTFKDYPDTTVYGSVYYSGTYKMVYFSLPFEAIDHATQRYVQKWTILRRIMNFFGEQLPYAVDEVSSAANLRVGSLQVVPNPVSQNASIEYGLSRRLPVSVKVYDSRGALVRVVAAGIQDRGWHKAAWDLRDVSGRAVAGGVYFCSVSAGPDYRSTKVLVSR